jgi:hypothetical protein
MAATSKLEPIMRGLEPLIDEVPKKIEPRDDGLAEVRAAWNRVADHERREQLADEFTAEGVDRALYFENRIRQVGPNAAKEASYLYASRPRHIAEPEEDRNEDDHTASARAAFRQESRKQSPADHARARAGIDALARDHGSVDVLNKYARWHNDFRSDPHGAAVRTAQEIATTVNDSIADQQARTVVTEWRRQNPHVSAEQEHVMQDLLTAGHVMTLPEAANEAKRLLALDEPDLHRRAVIAAQRQAEAPMMRSARQEVAIFEQQFPEVRSNKTLRARMQKLLASEKARTIEEAYRMAKGK